MTRALGPSLWIAALWAVCLVLLSGCDRDEGRETQPEQPQPRAKEPRTQPEKPPPPVKERGAEPEETEPPAPPAPVIQPAPFETSETTTTKEGATMAELAVKSEAFSEGQTVPKKYTGEGQDVSPPLSWSGVPEGAKELALICDDPDAPTPEPWVHWVIYKIPASARGLAENIERSAALSMPPGALQGKNSWNRVGYGGPMPPPGHGVHHYHFKLYALDAELKVEPGLTKNALLATMKGHVLAEAELMGTYQRN